MPTPKSNGMTDIYHPLFLKNSILKPSGVQRVAQHRFCWHGTSVNFCLPPPSPSFWMMIDTHLVWVNIRRYGPCKTGGSWKTNQTLLAGLATAILYFQNLRFKSIITLWNYSSRPYCLLPTPLCYRGKNFVWFEDRNSTSYHFIADFLFWMTSSPTFNRQSTIEIRVSFWRLAKCLCNGKLWFHIGDL